MLIDLLSSSARFLSSSPRCSLSLKSGGGGRSVLAPGLVGVFELEDILEGSWWEGLGGVWMDGGRILELEKVVFEG